MVRGWLVGVAILALSTCAITASAEVLLEAGTPDAYAPPTEPAVPSSELQAIFVPTNGYGDFDANPSIDVTIAHSFDLSSFSGSIVGGELEFRVKGSSINGVETDGLFLLMADGVAPDFSSAQVYFRRFGAFGTDPGLLTGGTWGAASDETAALDLSALPLEDGSQLDLIPLLNEKGVLDVLVADESGADYIHLRLQLAPAVPLSGIGATLVLASALTVIGTVRVRRPTARRRPTSGCS